MINKLKKTGNYKILIGVIIGILLSTTFVFAVSKLESKEISYNNHDSGLKSDNVKGAIDELYTKAKNKCPGSYDSSTSFITAAYTYNEDTCYSGTENNCKETTCYKNSDANSCPAGTIINYRVNDSETELFYVLYDQGDSLTMISSNTVYGNWISKEDYIEAGGIESDWDPKWKKYIKGPITITKTLDEKTKNWTNVNDQSYTMGTTIFKTNANTGCTTYNMCNAISYTWPLKVSKARLLTIQEAVDLGCTLDSNSCPKFLNNSGWMMSSHYTSNGSENNAWIINSSRELYTKNVDQGSYGRAVVVITK